MVLTSCGVPVNVPDASGSTLLFAYRVSPMMCSARRPREPFRYSLLRFRSRHPPRLESRSRPLPRRARRITFPRVLTSFLASRRSRDSVVAGWNPSGRCRMPSVIIVPRGVSFSAPSSASSSGTLLGVGYSGRSGGRRGDFRGILAVRVLVSSRGRGGVGPRRAATDRLRVERAGDALAGSTLDVPPERGHGGLLLALVHGAPDPAESSLVPHGFPTERQILAEESRALALGVQADVSHRGTGHTDPGLHVPRIVRLHRVEAPCAPLTETPGIPDVRVRDTKGRCTQIFVVVRSHA